MNDNNQKEMTQKTIKIEQDLIDIIEKLGREAERDFSKQVRYMLRDWLKIKDYL